MKQLIYLAVLLTGLTATAAAPPEISEKVLKAFKETFSGAENVTWKELDNSSQATRSFVGMICMVVPTASLPRSLKNSV